MAKKLTLLLAALAVVAAFAVPASAAAEDVLLPVGTEIRISSTTFNIQSNLLGTIKCSEWEWKGILNENGGKLLIKNMPGSAKECVNGTKTVVVESTEITQTKIEEGVEGHGTLNYSVHAKVGAELKCTWEGSGTFTYTIGTDKSVLEGSGIKGSPAACGTAKVAGGEATDQYKGEKGWEPVKWL